MATQSISDLKIDEEIAHWLKAGAPREHVLKFDVVRLLHRIDLNGVGSTLAQKSNLTNLRDDLAQSLRRRLIAREMWEEQHKRLLSQALDALAATGLKPILMKGTALAYSHYPKPSARSRGDSDILIEEDRRERAFEALEGAGFCASLIPGEATISEKVYQKQDLAGQLHDFDLHWRLSNSAALSNLFDHAELSKKSIPIPPLGKHARRMGNIDALLFACVHRRIHMDGNLPMYVNGEGYDCPDSLTWLMDIQLLYDGLPSHERAEFVALAREKGISMMCAGALQSAHKRLGLPVDRNDLRTLEEDGEGWVETYLAASYTKKHLINLRSQRDIKKKTRYIAEVLLPDGAFLRQRFGRNQSDWLLTLYLRRFLMGFRRFMLGKRDSS